MTEHRALQSAVVDLRRKLPMNKSTEFLRLNNASIRYLAARETVYEEEYFSKEYEAQYGSTYLQDKPKLLQRLEWRWEKTQTLFTAPPHRLLEIGCAAGFFLEYLQGEIEHLEGWEISQEMCQYAAHLGLLVRNVTFFEGYHSWQKNKEDTFDVVAAFYVIEHIKQQARLWKALRNLVTPGGLLLLAVPSTFGPMYYLNFGEWRKTHPQDHFVDYSPLSIKKVGAQYGFIRVAHFAEGIHPSRFHLPNLFDPVLGWMQKKFAFSDTCYIILRRKED